jgi:lycopene cyclase domain-containing protein
MRNACTRILTHGTRPVNANIVVRRLFCDVYRGNAHLAGRLGVRRGPGATGIASPTLSDSHDPGSPRSPRPDEPTGEAPVIPSFAYLVVIVLSMAGMLAIDRRLGLGVRGRPLLVAVLVVEVAFLAFDLVGSARGWFESNPDYVIAIIPPGIPPEEPLLLAFLTVFTLVVFRLAGRLTGEE